MRPRVLIVCEHASAQFGGEAALPLHYFRVLRSRRYDVWLITHARTRAELARLFPGEDRIHFVEDTRLHRLMWRVSRFLPAKLAYITVGFVQRFACQLEERRLARRLITQHQIDLVHQPMPVSPREPSLMHGLGVPVVIGPMNGGLDYPPAFRKRSPFIERLFMSVGRWSAATLNWLIPGKRRAAVLLVANALTRRSLPSGVCTRVIEVVENGVDLSIWRRDGDPEPPLRPQAAVTFLFLGRLVDWKSVDLLLLALQRAARQAAIRLVIVGDGAERERLQALATGLGFPPGGGTGHGSSVSFTGWLSQIQAAEQLKLADCLVLPSLLECGGAVVLEAMCAGKPVIATAWGGPTDYLDDTCGLLVPPTGREELIQGLADAMIRLASSPETRRTMGERGREKARTEYDWEIKVDRVLEIYRQALAPGAARHSARSTSPGAQTTLR
jgi:glycosyltransferase involved in cell wall biosynthesis